MKEGPLETAGKFLCFLRKETLPPPVLQGGYRAKKIMSKFFFNKNFKFEFKLTKSILL